MPKIKNWSRNKQQEKINERLYVWENNVNNRSAVAILKTGDRHNRKYFVEVKTPNPRNDFSRVFEKKREAREWAVQWMKSNPRG